MAGHSKWKNIQHRKGSQDKKRAKAFTKIGIELQVASREGGTDPASNPRLRTAMLKARGANMPKDIIDRNIKRGQSRLSGGEEYKEKYYEGFGPGGAALIVECFTDNVNRTAGEIRYIFSRGGAELATTGSVSWMFERQGYLCFSKLSDQLQESLWESAASMGADDIIDVDEISGLEILTPANEFARFKETLEKIAPTQEAELIWHPKTTVTLSAEDGLKLRQLIDSIENSEDVQNVYENSVL